MTTTDNLQAYRSTVTSQAGEDGIIAEIFRRIGVSDPWCAELGAWDGKYLSNTYTLWHDAGWHAVLIEADPKRLATLMENARAYPKVKPVNCYVTQAGTTSLDGVLAAAAAPVNLDLLSIDIDSNDYYLFESLQQVRPRVVIIEFNPTIPPSLDLVQEHASRINLGASARAVVRLGHEKGYGLAACTDCNCVLVRADEYAKLGIKEPCLEEIFPKQFLNYLISSYSGRHFLSREPIFGKLKLGFGRNLKRLVRSLFVQPGFKGLKRVHCFEVRTDV